MTRMKAFDFCTFCDNPVSKNGHCEYCRGATSNCFACGEDIDVDEPKNLDRSGNTYHWKCYRTSPLTTCGYCHTCFGISESTTLRGGLHYHDKCFYKIFFCRWCNSEILDDQKREKGSDNTNYHSGCLKEKIEIDKYITHINDWGGRLSVIFPKSKERMLFDGGGSGEPPLVTGILKQMNATNWKLSSIIFDITPDDEEKTSPVAPPQTTKEIVPSPRSKAGEPLPVTEMVRQMNALDWKIEFMIFDITPDKEETKTPKPSSPTKRRQR